MSTSITSSAPDGSVNNLLSSGNGSSLAPQSLGQADFLRLFTSQLQYQDPLNPMSNADLVAQMATISNTSGIAEMNSSLKTISDSISSSRLGDAASWIGRSMLVTSNIAAPDAQGYYAGRFTLANAASAVSVNLVDGNGNTVKTIDLGAQNAGDISFGWDGRDASGNYIAGQPLQVKIVGATPSGVATWASIAAVQSPADGSLAKLITPLGTFAPTDALQLT